MNAMQLDLWSLVSEPVEQPVVESANGIMEVCGLRISKTEVPGWVQVADVSVDKKELKCLRGAWCNPEDLSHVFKSPDRTFAPPIVWAVRSFFSNSKRGPRDRDPYISVTFADSEDYERVHQLIQRKCDVPDFTWGIQEQVWAEWRAKEGRHE